MDSQMIVSVKAIVNLSHHKATAGLLFFGLIAAFHSEWRMALEAVKFRTYLAVQWLRLCTFNAREGSILVGELGSCCMSENKKREQEVLVCSG